MLTICDVSRGILGAGLRLDAAERCGFMWRTNMRHVVHIHVRLRLMKDRRILGCSLSEYISAAPPAASARSPGLVRLLHVGVALLSHVVYL